MFHKCLALPECEIKLKGDSGHFAGYASKFGGVDSYNDTIERGAYAQTLREYGHPKMYIQHDSRGLPVGKWISAKEDDHGLFVEGEFTPGNVRADEARAALKHGVVDGLSIGYVLKKQDYEEREDGVRVIKNVSKLVEVSIVTFPADDGARVDLSSVKYEDVERIETVRDFARFLRDAGSMSKGLADALTSRAKVVLLQGEPATETDAKAERLMDELRQFKQRLAILKR
jgi:HK97 family phage prohead protease